MDKENDFLPKINRNDLIKAKNYLWVYLSLFEPDGIYHNHREILPRLNSSQQTLSTFYLMDNSMRSSHSYIGDSDPAEKWSIKGGFLQLIYNGFGEYVFEKPFSKIIKTWGMEKTSEIIEKAKSIYGKHKGKVEKVKTEKELSHLYSEITDFEMLDNEYRRIIGEETEKIKEYIENNINEFAIIDESNSQASNVDRDIQEIEETMGIIEEVEKESVIIHNYIENNMSKFTINDEDNTLVISASAIFGKNGGADSIIKTKINGKWVTIKISKDRIK